MPAAKGYAGLKRLKKILILDGTAAGDGALWPLLDALIDELERKEAEVRVFSLRDLKLAHCIGDFGCWLETPGLCIYNEPHFREILETHLSSDTTILFTRVAFGGYSSQLKQFIDRFVSLVLPYFESYHGEMHHKPRYSHYPRLVGIGIQSRKDRREAELFKLLVGRNAINFHAPSFAAEVVAESEDLAQIRETFGSLLVRNDRFPTRESVKALNPTTGEAMKATLSTRGHACLIVGSPKTKSPSTSNVLGNRVMDRLRTAGWETESLTLGPALQFERGQRELVAAADRANLLIFAFPLYVDSLPFLMTKALELISDYRSKTEDQRPQGLCVIVNNGFIESYQDYLALSICRQFAEKNGITWMGGLALGGGEALVRGEQLISGKMTHPELSRAHLIKALDAVGDELAEGQPVPTEAVEEITRSPIPHAPYVLWRLLFTRNGGKMWENRASKNGVTPLQMLGRPYAADPNQVK